MHHALFNNLSRSSCLPAPSTRATRWILAILVSLTVSTMLMAKAGLLKLKELEEMSYALTPSPLACKMIKHIKSNSMLRWLLE